MSSWLKHWGIAFFGGFVYFCVAALNKPICDATTEWVIAGCCLVVAIYQYITGLRLAKWEDWQKQLEKEKIGKPQPNDPIVAIVRQIIRKIKHQL